MNTTLIKWIDLMTAQAWIRMTVCLSPGLILQKLGATIQSSSVTLVGTIFLLLGVALFGLWGRFIKYVLPHIYSAEKSLNLDDEGSFVDEKSNDRRKDRKVTMDDLAILCNNDYKEASRLVSLESKLNSNISYQESLELAFKRKSFE